MNTLPEKFNFAGSCYRLVTRNDKAAVYSLSYPPSERTIGFDTFTIHRRAPRIIKGKLIAGGEGLPRPEDYGYSAWSYGTLEAAMQKYRALIGEGTKP